MLNLGRTEGSSNQLLGFTKSKVKWLNVVQAVRINLDPLVLNAVRTK